MFHDYLALHLLSNVSILDCSSISSLLCKIGNRWVVLKRYPRISLSVYKLSFLYLRDLLSDSRLCHSFERGYQYQEFFNSSKLTVLSRIWLWNLELRSNENLKTIYEIILRKIHLSILFLKVTFKAVSHEKQVLNPIDR